MTGTIGTSFTVYHEWALGSAGHPEAWTGRNHLPSGVDSKPLAPGERITSPAAVALFERPVPASWVQRAYTDLRQYRRLPRGGHFPALDAPDLLAADIREFFQSLHEPT